MKHLRTWIPLLLVLATATPHAHSRALAMADSLFAERHTGLKDTLASPDNARKALTQYTLATAEPGSTAKAWAGRLHCSSFLGTYTRLSKEERKSIFAESALVADTAARLFPNDPDVLFWATVQWARYAEEHGVLKVARTGVPSKLHRLTSRLEQVAPGYDEGSTWMIKGLVYDGTPRIPFVLEWPSKSVAEESFRKALAAGPHKSLNQYLLGEFLFQHGRKNEARPYLEAALRIPAETHNLSEEAYYRARVRALLAKY